ncbi:DUF2787 domain-containing protein [Paraglaciecola aquimarina]|uniref:DUF2787 domain-containing protein n=1 Tax=Paraglaciecola algarum TaxID=3050085 RepID=A0ABS9D8L0_9ALTE|nr:DUF2787 family protein [Paraglaciecola sp. G1-23]MCF2949259.1 DUF2787 domain-containing protein [Paraglaciecola sp. G1-23]
MRIQHEGLALPVSKLLVDALTNVIEKQSIDSDAVTINFRDPTYSAEGGGFHPVEIRLEKRVDYWQLCYVTDFCYVGNGYNSELAKDLDFDFQAGVFQNMFGVYPIESATDMYQIWESNFLHYWFALSPYKVTVSG